MKSSNVRKPLIIYVSGAPGSGKTTLAKKISDEFYIPHVSSDLVHGGVRFTAGSPNDRRESLFNAFLASMIFMAERSVSFVVDHVLQKDMSEVDIIDKLKPLAQVVYIHTTATDPISRHHNREISRTDKGVVLGPEEQVARRKFHASNITKTANPLDLGLPTLVVNTDNNYEPNFAKIVEFIEQAYNKGGQ